MIWYIAMSLRYFLSINLVKNMHKGWLATSKLLKKRCSVWQVSRNLQPWPWGTLMRLLQQKYSLDRSSTELYLRISEDLTFAMTMTILATLNNLTTLTKPTTHPIIIRPWWPWLTWWPWQPLSTWKFLGIPLVQHAKFTLYNFKKSWKLRRERESF